MALNKALPVQLHYQLANELREYIKMGRWKLGELFPTDREFMTQYGVSATTVRRAVGQLVQEGWLERIPGKGTFIKREPLQEKLGRLTGFFEEARDKGLSPKARLISAELTCKIPTLCNLFPELATWNEEQVFVFHKIHLIDDEPIATVISCWKREIGQKLLAYDLEQEGLYEVAEKHLGLALTQAEQDIFAGGARGTECKELLLKKGAPVLIMNRTAYAGEVMVEFSHNVYRADRYRYHVTLRKQNPMGGIVLHK